MQLELWNTAAVSGGVDVGHAGLRPAPPDFLAPRLAWPDTTRRPELDALRQLDTRAQHYLDSARAPRTRDLYDRDFRRFATWCTEHGLPSLPASARTLARYLTQVVEGGRKVSTAKRARVAIGMAHADAGLPRPDEDPRIRKLERGLGKTFGTREQGAEPLLFEHVTKIALALGVGAREDRDRVLILVGFLGALRSNELIALRFEDLTILDSELSVQIAHGEDGRAERDHVRIAAAPQLQLCAVDAVRRWLGRVGRPTGPLLRSVAGERVMECGMKPRAITRVVQRLTRRAAIRGEYSAQSLRAGFATSAYLRGVREREIQEHGRWRERRSLDRYIQLRSTDGQRTLSEAFYG